MEHDYLALLAIGSGPSKQILTEDTSSIANRCFSDTKKKILALAFLIYYLSQKL